MTKFIIQYLKIMLPVVTADHYKRMNKTKKIVILKFKNVDNLYKISYIIQTHQQK